MTFTIRPGVREKIGLLFGIAGASGSGKTYSALLLAKGLANGTGRIAVIDTEAGRALHYAPLTNEAADAAKGTFDFLHLNFQPPFTPERYIEAIRAAEEAGATVIVLDSASHEWAGEGGCSDIQMAEAERMARAAAAKNNGNWESMLDAMTAPAWKKPKQRHQRMVSRIIQTRSHLIFCFRAQEKVKIVNRQVVPVGFQPICEKSIMFEMSASMTMHPSSPGCPSYELPKKLNAEMQSIFPDGVRINEDAGKRLRAWAELGVNRAAPDKIFEGVRDLIDKIQDAETLEDLEKLTADPQVIKQRAYLVKNRPELAERVDAEVKAVLSAFTAASDGDSA